MGGMGSKKRGKGVLLLYHRRGEKKKGLRAKRRKGKRDRGSAG